MSQKGWWKLRYALNRFSVPFSRKNRACGEYERYYPVFYKYKILLPFLPFHRILRGLKNGNMANEVKALKEAKVKSR